jgi:tetratricopeptide (TPR) repeat protein
MQVPESADQVVFEEVESVEFFISCVRRSLPDYRLREEQRAPVFRICALVDGMPLAIQLAAAWATTLSPEEILEELAADIDILSTRMQDIPDRQRSIRAVFNYSWTLLTRDQQDSLKKLSVFRGGFTLKAARAISGAGVRTLNDLVERSLLQRALDGRFHIHELTRQFADEELANDSQLEANTRDHHLSFYANFLNSHAPNLIGNIVILTKGLEAISTELDNCLAAWDWGIRTRNIRYLSRAEFSLLDYFSWANLYTLGHSTANKSVDAIESWGLKNLNRQERILYWKLFAWQVCWFGQLSGLENLSAWEETIDQIVNSAINEDAVSDLGFSFFPLLSRTSTDYLRARGPAFFDPLEEIYRQEGKLFELGLILNIKANYLRYDLGQTVEAQKVLENMLAAAKACESIWVIAFAYTAFTDLWIQNGDYQKAEYYCRQALRLSKETLRFGNIVWVMTIQRDLAAVLRNLGKYPEAIELLQEAGSALGEQGFFQFLPGVYNALAEIYAIVGDFAEAKKSLEASLKYSTDNEIMLARRAFSMGRIAYLQDDFDNALAHFTKSLIHLENWHKRSDSEQAAVVLAHVGEVQRALGQHTAAWSSFEKAVRLNIRVGFIGGLMTALLGVAFWLKDFDRFQEAIEIASYLVQSAGTVYVDRERAEELLDKLVGPYPTNDFEAFIERGKTIIPKDIYERYWGGSDMGPSI